MSDTKQEPQGSKADDRTASALDLSKGYVEGAAKDFAEAVHKAQLHIERTHTTDHHEQMFFYAIAIRAVLYRLSRELDEATDGQALAMVEQTVSKFGGLAAITKGGDS